jgi:UDP-3-O-[3-hydroxymyristoyl] N-acetylglucosamine deacetylase/3-hydroxyacyl-[acyl-carrier-protein] dehydratase
MQIDNVLIEIDGEEVPILDGSAEPFVQALQKTGTREQDAPKIYYEIQQNITFIDEDKKVEMVALPFNEYRINTLIDFNSPVLGTQHADLRNIADLTVRSLPAALFAFFMNWKCCWPTTSSRAVISTMQSWWLTNP